MAITSNRKLDHKLRVAKTDDLVFRVHEYDIDTEAHHVYLMGSEMRAVGDVYEGGEPGIEYTIANRFIRNMNHCMRLKPGKKILIHMKSNGGFWEEGLAIRDTIHMVSRLCPTTILNYTHARSMTSMIFLAANKRVMMPNSNFMFHTGTAEFYGTSKQLQTEAELDKMYQERMLGYYIKALKERGSMSKWSRKRIREWLIDRMNKKEEVYIMADEAVRLGFADEIFDGDWKRLQGHDDLQKYRNHPNTPITL